MKRVGIILTLCVLLLITSCTAPEVLPQDVACRIYFLNVGQGDCTLIRTQHGDVLIDSGPESAQEELCLRLEQLGVVELVLAVFTHPDEDHIGGADEVVNGITIKNVILPALDESDVPTTKVYEKMIAAIEAKEEINVIAAEAGAEYTIGELKMKLLAPISDNYSNINDYSVSARFDFGSTSFLFTGDALEKSEAEMLEKWPVSELDCDFFQAGHHGAANANTPNFIKAVSPVL